MRIFSLLTIVFLSIYKIFAKDINDIYREVETYLKNVAFSLKDNYSNRCFTKCKCSLSGCSNLKYLVDCNSSVSINQCKCQGRMVNFQESILHISNFEKTKEEIENEVENNMDLRQEICYTSILSDIIKSVNRPSNIVSTYVSTLNGVFRQHPGLRFCREYDHRRRPWFVGTISGMKNLIITIDISKNTSILELDTMKKVAKYVIDGMNSVDSVSVFTYDKEMTLLISLYGTDSNKTEIKKKIDDIKISENDFLYQNYIQNILRFIKNLFYEGYFVVSDILIINLSKGSFKDDIDISLAKSDDFLFYGEENTLGGYSDLEKDYFSKFIKVISDNKEKYKIDHNIIFVNLLFNPDEISKNVFHSISCKTNNIVYILDLKTFNLFDFTENLMQIYLLGKSSNNDEIFWTSPYISSDDSFWTITASINVYDETVIPKYLAFVLSIDIDITFITEYVNDQIFILDEVFKIKASNFNFRFNANECELDFVRKMKCLPNKYSTNECLYITNKKKPPICNNISTIKGNMYCHGKEDFDYTQYTNNDTLICCLGCDSYKYILLSVFGLLVLLIIIFTIFYIVKNYKREKVIEMEKGNEILRSILINHIFSKEKQE